MRTSPLREENERLRRALAKQEGEYAAVLNEQRDIKNSYAQILYRQRLRQRHPSLVTKEEDTPEMFDFHRREMRIILLEEAYENMIRLADKGASFLDSNSDDDSELLEEHQSFYRVHRHWHRHRMTTEDSFCGQNDENEDPTIPMNLDADCWKELLNSYANGNPQKLKYLTSWIRYVLLGGSIGTPDAQFRAGVELSYLSSELVEMFSKVLIPAIHQYRPDLQVHVLTKTVVDRSLRIVVMQLSLQEAMEASKVFIPDKEYVWLPAFITRTNGSVVTVKVEEHEWKNQKMPRGMSLGSVVGAIKTIDLSKPDVIEVIQSRTVKSSTNSKVALPLQNKPQTTSNGFEDMISVDHLHEGAILYNLRQRFFGLLPYTYTGKICIAVNPYQWLGLYSPETMQQYMDGSRDKKPPHVYSVSMEAFFHMREHNINQSILVSGESGAGKTETTKIMMNHVATLSSHLCASQEQMPIVKRIIQSNPLLESFGNAATTRNDNSSRFGKFTELQFDAKGRLMGARAHTYLLEKSRVTHQAPGERTFHIFYQVLEAANTDLSYLQLQSSHRYVRQDKQLELEHTWKETQAGLSIVGIPQDMQSNLWLVLGAILHLGEVDFEMIAGDVDSSFVQKKDSLTIAAKLLGIPLADLEKVLTHRTVVVGREVIAKPMTCDQARDCRDAVAKSLYSTMFTWLVEQINAAIGVHQMAYFIGILDIFGFEAFDHNSFEQLCINYANEKLQQKFVQDVLKTVQAEYEEEGITWSHVQFADNQDVLDLIEGRLGVLSLLNEESSLATGTDASFAHKLSAVMDNHARFETPRLQSSAFIILHYAGKVLYDTNGFLDKHRDALLPDIKRVLSESSLPLVRKMFPAPQSPHDYRNKKTTAANRQNTRAITVGTQFKESLAQLMEKISQTNVHYVRCIKPNSQKTPYAFDHPSVVDQLRCAGVIEAIRVSRSAYPSRVSHLDCLKSYALLAPSVTSYASDEVTRSSEHARTDCNALLAKLFPKGHIVDYQVGLSRVYFREGILEVLEQQRGVALTKYAIRIQKHMKRYLYRKKFLIIRAATIKIQSYLRRWHCQMQYSRFRRNVITVQAQFRGYKARKRVLAMRTKRAITKLQAVVRGFQVRKRYYRLKCAAVKVQSFWRITYLRRIFLKRLAQEKERRALGSKVLHLQNQLGTSKKNLKPNQGDSTSPTMSRPHTALFNESSQVLGTLAAENKALREQLARQEDEINALKEENRKMRDALQAKELEDKVKNLSMKSQEATQMAYLAHLEEEYERVRTFLCSVFDLPGEVGLLKNAPPSKEELLQSLPQSALNSKPTKDLAVAKNEAFTLLQRSATRLYRIRSKDNKQIRGSSRRVKDYWDEIKTNSPPLPYTLGSTPWKRLLTDWAQGNPKKLDYMSRWLQNVLEGGDIENGPFPLGVELKSVTPMMLEGFIQLVIPKLAERPDIKVHVHTKEFIGTSMRITLEVKEGVPKMKPIKLGGSPPGVPTNYSKRDTNGSLDQWGRHSIMSVNRLSVASNSTSDSLRSTQSSSLSFNETRM
ncbi:myosin [Thraustotheca clavata]|uniref:Myosin n=1 Tax=Thraustotheca clavata TaxID=74557 RepID=A0A1V9ZHF3_9STRA|nr:myosin [Thraustotheca clavata]